MDTVPNNGHPALLSSDNPRRWIVCVILAVLTFIVYSPVLQCDFVCYDDPDYYTANHHVLGGLTGDNILWAFTTGAGANWHPVTWLSLIVDGQLFGKHPAGPHVVNLALHMGNVLLLFLLLLRLTSAPWRSAIVAVLFALHPLHVESVAWIAERKDVLSAFFGLLSLYAYAAYGGVQKGSSRKKLFYGLALAAFVVGLMAKPMLVTLPFVMLLLDFWPLGRFGLDQGSETKNAVRRLVVEKIPFFLASVAVSIVTVVAQKSAGAVATMTMFPMAMRIQNAFVSYASYLGKTICPIFLATPYPHPGFWPVGWVLFSIALFVTGGTMAFFWRKKFPFVFVGWFIFAGMLVPVIGLVQVGMASMADRYMYLPLIGLLIIVVWGGAEFVFKRRYSVENLFLSVAVIVIALAMVTWRQIGFWRNDGTLFSHALAVTRNNYVASIDYGWWLSRSGRADDAVNYYYQAVKMAPGEPTALYDVGNAFARAGYWDDAIMVYRSALRITPDQADILDNLGLALARKKQFAEAATNFEAALKVNPDSANAHNNLGSILFIQKNYEAAATQFYKAIKLSPDEAQLYVNLGDTLARLDKPAAAGECYRQALQLMPDAKVQAKLNALVVRGQK